MSRDEIKDRFDLETALSYRRQPDPAWLPDFRQMVGLVPELLRPRLPDDALILDIGSGTGNTSLFILEALQDVKMVLMDFSEDMLSQVPNVLADFSGRYEIILYDFLDADFGTQKYAAVVSSFAIHHCRGETEYSRIYSRLFKALQPGGIFVCCDVVAGADDQLTKLNEEGWRSNMKEQLFSNTEVERTLYNYHQEDSPMDLWSHLKLLRKAGFETIDVIWKHMNFRGLYRRKTVLR